MEINKDISVAFAVYNGAAYIEKQLLSIVAQEVQPYEIVIVDDNSSDGSDKIISTFNFGAIKLRYYKNEVNLGPIGNFKKAINLCEGAFVALCDQDDIWLPNKLKTLYNVISAKAQDKPLVVFSDVTLMQGKEEIIAQSLFKEVWRIKPDQYKLEYILIENMIIGCSSIINSAMKQEVLLMPTNGIVMHDYWMTLIAKCLGNVYFIDEPLLLYRSHSASVTTKIPATTIVAKFKRELDIRRGFLSENIQQAKKFKEIYKDRLAEKDLKTINFFISLAKYPFVIKRLYAKALKMITNK